MDERAERDEAETRLAVAVFVVALVALGLAPQRGGVGRRLGFGVGRRLEVVAGGGGERHDRAGGERQAEGGLAERPAGEQPARDPQHRVADDAAEPGRQRPARRNRQHRRAAGRQHRSRPPTGSSLLRMRSRRFSVVRRQPQWAGGISATTQARPKNCMATSATTAPGRPSRLWIGVDGRVVEAGVGDRPGHQRRAGGDQRGEHAEADELRRPPLRRLPQRVGQVVQKRERRGAHRSTARPQPWRTHAALPEMLGGAS